MSNKESKILNFVEKHGIVNYKVKGNNIIFYKKEVINCQGTLRTYKHIFNIKDNTQTVKELYKKTNRWY